MTRMTWLWCLVLGILVWPVGAQTDAPIDAYYSPCREGTDAEIFSWHGINQDGKPPVDMTRNAFHFICDERDIFAIYGGEVWGATQRWGGLILVDDAEHDVCIVYLGLETVVVERGDEIETGHYLGKYLYQPHITALDIPCEATNWYNSDARDYEVPIAFYEIGYVIAPDLQANQSIPFVSENPSQEPDADDS